MSAVPAERARILLVDDSMLMRKAASKMLGEEFDVVTAVDGDDGWTRIQADTSIQVVFTDLSMPRMDGYALLQMIRAAEDEGTLNMPVIVVTGAENDEAARKQALDLGATDFITKPFSSIDLLARARAHSNYRRIARRLELQITLDALTGLANKAGFLDRLQQDIAFAHRLSKPLTLVRIEIDAFRNVFLTHGKARAEALIKHVAQILHERVRAEDSAARLGLAGFALALPAGEHEGSKALIERLRVQLAGEPLSIDGASIPFTISAAVSTPELHASLSAISALDVCEQLLQVAIREGGNRVLGDAPAAAPTVDDPDATAFDVANLSAMLAAIPSADVTPQPATPAPPVAAPTKAAQLKPASPPRPDPGTATKPAAATARTPAAPVPAAVASPVPAATVPDSIDETLRSIDRGEIQTVAPHLPLILKRLMPLFRLLSARQRGQLVSYLQKLGA